MDPGVVQDNYAHCETLVRTADKDRFLASLFAPADKRRHLFALYAFNVEIVRVREVVREPLPGEMRLQWWRDALTGEGQGEARAHPVASALIDTIAACGVQVEPLLALIEARSFDLYGDPMPDLDALEGYSRKTSSALIELAATILADATDPAIGAAAAPGGIASAIARLLQSFPAHASRGQVYVPIEVLNRHGVDAADILAGRATPELGSALAQMRSLARSAFAEFEAQKALIPAPARAAFLPVALVPALLACLEARADPFVPVELPQWRRQWALWSAAR